MDEELREILDKELWDIVEKINKEHSRNFYLNLSDTGEGVASLNGNKITVVRENIWGHGKMGREAHIIHECCHSLFEDLNQTPIFAQADELGIPKEKYLPYLESEIDTWNKVVDLYPEYEEVGDCYIKQISEIAKSLLDEFNED